MLLPALLLVPLLFTSGAVAAALPTEGAAALMVDPQAVQNLAPFETGLPHCGQTFSVCVPAFFFRGASNLALLPVCAPALSLLPEGLTTLAPFCTGRTSGLCPAGCGICTGAPHSGQNFVPEGIMLPQFPQGKAGEAPAP